LGSDALHEQRIFVLEQSQVVGVEEELAGSAAELPPPPPTDPDMRN
jgi:hypothetical protein